MRVEKHTKLEHTIYQPSLKVVRPLKLLRTRHLKYIQYDEEKYKGRQQCSLPAMPSHSLWCSVHRTCIARVLCITWLLAGSAHCRPAPWTQRGTVQLFLLSFSSMLVINSFAFLSLYYNKVCCGWISMNCSYANWLSARERLVARFWNRRWVLGGRKKIPLRFQSTLSTKVLRPLCYNKSYQQLYQHFSSKLYHYYIFFNVYSNIFLQDFIAIVFHWHSSTILSIIFSFTIFYTQRSIPKCPLMFDDFSPLYLRVLYIDVCITSKIISTWI